VTQNTIFSVLINKLCDPIVDTFTSTHDCGHWIGSRLLAIAQDVFILEVEMQKVLSLKDQVRIVIL
jgi:hypothetical protein